MSRARPRGARLPGAQPRADGSIEEATRLLFADLANEQPVVDTE